jgi:hypothetical protein
VIDTRDKRASAASLPALALLPAPDGVIDAGDRRQLLGLYRGFAATPPPTAPADRRPALRGSTRRPTLKGSGK